MSETQVTIDSILDRFLTENQRVFTEYETLGLTTEAIEVTLVPMLGKIFVNIKEFANNTVKQHKKDCPLATKEVDFDEHLKKHLSPSVAMRATDMNNLSPEDIEALIPSKEETEDTMEDNFNQEGEENGNDNG